MALSVHDNVLLSYTVDAAGKQITLRTAYLDGATPEYTEVVFRGVLAYRFEKDNLETILFDVTEVPLDRLCEQDRAHFERLRIYGWPRVDCPSVAEFLILAAREGARGFELSSSLGMEGWVCAQEMTITRLDLVSYSGDPE